MIDREKVIKEFADYVHYFKPYCIGDIEDHAMLKDVLALLQEQEARSPVHIHEEYPEHDWETDEDGNIDEWVLAYDYHNGPRCKRCNYSFCIHCTPNGWNKKPCIIDEYKCPKCGRYISKGTKFCSDCGQAVKWNV